MNILENNIFPNKKPVSAHGHPCIELWEPRSRKIVQKVEGDNMVFTAAMEARNYIPDMLSNDSVYLTDSEAAIDANFPYLLGQVIGYGSPSAGSYGLYRGAYSAANQVLAEQSLNSIRWKFQYEFTPSQANGVIRSLGLTQQFTTTGSYKLRPKFSPKYNSTCTNYYMNTCDGRYSYACNSSTGVVTKWDNWLCVESTIDVSAIIGKTSQGAIVGYEPANGRYHIWVYIAGASRWYVFSDNTFATCVANYTPSNLTGWPTYNLYIRDNKAYQFTGANVAWVDYINNINWTSVGAPPVCNSTGLNLTNFNYGNCHMYGSIIAGGFGQSVPGNGVFFDISTGEYIGYFCNPTNWNANIPAFKVPLIDTNALTATSSGYSGPAAPYCAATSAYKLPTPVTKTSANGMTVTYELEIFWE